MITPLPRWAAVVIFIGVVAICIAPMIGDGRLLEYCIGWPLKMIGQLVLKYGLMLLALFVLISLIRFGYRKLVVK